ncbi:MAG TPA: hypothetical protein VHC96_23465 [Puia sp.]|nr:hypothetical protein [Puia sp.]
MRARNSDVTEERARDAALTKVMNEEDRVKAGLTKFLRTRHWAGTKFSTARTG